MEWGRAEHLWLGCMIEYRRPLRECHFNSNKVSRAIQRIPELECLRLAGDLARVLLLTSIVKELRRDYRVQVVNIMHKLRQGAHTPPHLGANRVESSLQWVEKMGQTGVSEWVLGL